MPPEIEIFAAGTHTSSNGVSVTLGESDLDAIASAYSPETFEAPAVVGHPKDDSPAYGWFKSLRRVGSKLLGLPHQVDPDFQEAVNAGRYKKISASFYKPDSPSNPKPGNWYLKHVGFLGGMAPAVKGLKTVAFNEQEEGVLEFTAALGEDGVVEFADYALTGVQRLFRNLREWFIDKYDLEAADRIIPSFELTVLGDVASERSPIDIDRVRFLESQVETLTSRMSELLQPTYTENTMTTEAQFAEREEQIKQREAQLQEREAKLKRDAIASFVESRVQGLQVRSADKDELIEFMCALPEGTVDFAEGKTQEPLQWFQGFLKNQPQLVNLKQVISDKDNSQDFSETGDLQTAKQKAADAYANASKRD